MGAGENIMFGGADPALPNWPSDIESAEPLYRHEWKGPGKKNLLETKTPCGC